MKDSPPAVTGVSCLRRSARAAVAAGARGERALEILGEGAAASRLLKSKMPMMFQRDFKPQFQLALMEKDLRYFLGMAQQLDRPTPIAALVRSQFQSARRASLGGLDACAVFLQAAGEKPPA